MKTLKIFALAALTAVSLGSCSDACDYLDAETDNPSWVNDYKEGSAVAHPETLAGTVWSRQSGLKTNAYGEDVQGFVESINFVSEDSCSVKMSEPQFPAHFNASFITWVDESNDEATPLYAYAYSDVTGAFTVKKTEIDDKGKVSLKEIFSGVAVADSRNVITVAHFGDTPTQSYLEKK